MNFLRLYGSPLVLLVGLFPSQAKGDAQSFFLYAVGRSSMSWSGVYAYFDGQMSHRTLQNEKRLMGRENLRLASLMSFLCSYRSLLFINTKNKLKSHFFSPIFLLRQCFISTKTRATMLIYIMSFSFSLANQQKSPAFWILCLDHHIDQCKYSRSLQRFVPYLCLCTRQQHRSRHHG